MFTKQNAPGFTAKELDTLNAALNTLVDAGFSEENAHDMVNNAYFEDATITDLIKRHVHKSFYRVSGGVAECCDHEGFDYEDNDSVLIFCRTGREALLISQLFEEGVAGYSNVFDDCGNVVAAVVALNDEQLDAAQAD